MFERFTERARQVVVLAQEEARTLKHNYITSCWDCCVRKRASPHVCSRVSKSR